MSNEDACWYSKEPNFEKRKYPLTITIAGEGSVSEEIISAGKSTTEYSSGSIIQLTASPTEGWSFSGWSGTVSSTENPIQLTVDEAKSITSTFPVRSLSFNCCAFSLVLFVM